MGSGQLPLALQQEGPHLRQGGHLGGVLGYRILPDGLGHILPIEEHMLYPVVLIPHPNVQLIQQREHLGGVPPGRNTARPMVR